MVIKRKINIEIYRCCRPKIHPQRRPLILNSSRVADMKRKGKEIPEISF